MLLEPFAAARLAVLASLLLLLLLFATLFLVALLLFLAGVISHFPSPAVALRHAVRQEEKPAPRHDVACISPGRGVGAVGARFLLQPVMF